MGDILDTDGGERPGGDKSKSSSESDAIVKVAAASPEGRMVDFEAGRAWTSLTISWGKWS
jgi:hypothetical protein